ncbi:hypothetical protein GWI33_012454, partial [Rhynchophorus ferrugineus]
IKEMAGKLGAREHFKKPGCRHRKKAKRREEKDKKAVVASPQRTVFPLEIIRLDADPHAHQYAYKI